MRCSTFLILSILLLAVAPRSAPALVDIPTTDRRAAELVELASASGVALPVDTTFQPVDDTAFLDAYQALANRGLGDNLGERVAAWVRARADGGVHLEFLRPRLGLRTYWADKDAAGRFLYHSGGDRLALGWNLFANATGAAFWGNRVGGEYDVQFDVNDGGTTGQVKRLYLKGVWGKWSFKVGRDTERLGVGYHGSLLLDDNAPPLDLWRIRTEEPLFLPWGLARLGGFRFMLMNGYLRDSDPSAPDSRYGSTTNGTANPRLLTLRASYHPTSWLDLGLSRAILYGGAGRAAFTSVRAYWKLLTTNENDLGPDYDSLQISAIDMVARLPALSDLGSLKGGKIYYQAAFSGLDSLWEDPAKKPLSRNHDESDQFGVYLTTAITDFRYEYTHIGSTWYQHSEYPQGYTYRSRPLGHLAGPDSRSHFFEIARYAGSDWRWDVNVDFRDASQDEKVQEWGFGLENRILDLFGYRALTRFDLLWANISHPVDDPTTDHRNEVYAGLGLQADF